MRIENIIFLQGQEAIPVLELLDNEGYQAAVKHLQQWHFPGEHEVREEPSAGTDDNVFLSGRYRLTYNSNLGYIGLEYRLKKGE